MKIDHESLIGTFEQKRELVQKFNLMDDDFFAVVMQDKAAFEVMLRILTQRDDLHVKEVRTQYNMRNLVGHSVILDGYAEDNEHKAYNVEIQVRDSDYHEKRVRYYQSNIDLTLLEKGVEYRNLPDLYLIFITSFDIFGEGKNHYKVRRMLEDSNREVPNGVHELYFNTKIKDDTRISELLQYFKNSSVDVEKFGPLSERVKYYKQTQEGVVHMCEAVKNYGNEREEIGKEIGKEIGEAKNLIQNVKNLMDNSGCSLDEALKMLSIDKSKYDSCLEIVINN